MIGLLVYSLRPTLHIAIEPALQPCAEALYDVVVERFVANDIDQEVKEKSIAAIGHAIAVLGEESTLARRQCLPILLSRMQNEV